MKIASSPLADLRAMPAGTRALLVMGVLLVTAGIWAPSPAGATFTGATNGNVAFASICGPTIGQAIYSVNPAGSPPPTYTCPGGTSPNYTQSTAGSIDSMPYFSAQGTTLYFSSNRASGSFAIYQVPYPATISGSPGTQTDGAVQLTSPGSSNDYAPTVSADGSELAFIRCNSGTTSCALYVQSPIATGTPTLVPTIVAPLLPDSVSGAASRPEIDPADPSQILYVGTDNHIHLVSLTSAFTERDLSSESGISSGQIDEYPDWNAAGTSIVFDRSHSVYVMYGVNPTAGTASACALWGSSDPGNEIEPTFSPTDTATSSSTTCNPSGNTYVWTTLGSGSNIVLDMGHVATGPDSVASLTLNKTNNSQPAWQPIPLGAQTPEVSMAVLLPGIGFALLAGAVLLDRQQRRKRRTAGTR